MSCGQFVTVAQGLGYSRVQAAIAWFYLAADGEAVERHNGKYSNTSATWRKKADAFAWEIVEKVLSVR